MSAAPKRKGKAKFRRLEIELAKLIESRLSFVNGWAISEECFTQICRKAARDWLSSFLGQFDAALRGAEQQKEKPQPLYYVRQPDGSFTVAEPQPIFQETHR